MTAAPPPEALDLVSTALGRALTEAISTGGPVLPTSMHRTREGDRLVRYRADRHDRAALAAARTALSGDEVAEETWVLVWDGYYTLEGWRTDALFAHLEVVDEPTAHLFVWRYGRLGSGEIDALEPRRYLGPDGRFADPGRSHPLLPDQARAARHGQVLRRRRRWRRRRWR